jgi:zinc transporter
MTPATYGSDPTGLICGFCFSADGVGGAVSADQALEFLAAEKLEGQAQGFVWLHFN